MTATRWKVKLFRTGFASRQIKVKVTFDKALILSFEVLSVHGLFAEIPSCLMIKEVVSESPSAMFKLRTLRRLRLSRLSSSYQQEVCLTLKKAKQFYSI